MIDGRMVPTEVRSAFSYHSADNDSAWIRLFLSFPCPLLLLCDLCGPRGENWGVVVANAP